MKRLVWPRPSPAVVVACIVFGFALGGTGVAAIQTTPDNNVRTSKNTAVTAANVANAASKTNQAGAAPMSAAQASNHAKAAGAATAGPGVAEIVKASRSRNSRQIQVP